MGMKVSKPLGQGAQNPDGSYIQADDPRLDRGLGDGGEVQQADHDPHERLDRPLLSDRPEERALRSGPVAAAGRYVRAICTQTVPTHEVIEKARENMHRKHPKTRFVNAHMAMLYYDPAKLAEVPRHLPERRRRDLGDACRISAARRGCGASSSSSIRIAC